MTRRRQERQRQLEDELELRRRRGSAGREIASLLKTNRVAALEDRMNSDGGYGFSVVESATVGAWGRFGRYVDVVVRARYINDDPLRNPGQEAGTRTTVHALGTLRKADEQEFVVAATWDSMPTSTDDLSERSVELLEGVAAALRSQAENASA